MCAFMGNVVTGPVVGILVLLVCGFVIYLLRGPIREARERRDQLRCREKLRREFWGNE